MPEGLFPGGAPLNVARDLLRLGNNAVLVSRVGDDVLGDEIVRRLGREGMSTDLIQVDKELPTGLVDVNADAADNPSYVIRAPAAWDVLELNDDIIKAAAESQMLVYGTLACRGRKSRETIHRLIEAAGRKVYDVNLRPGLDSRRIVEELLRSADIVKLNSQELEVLRGWFSLSPGDASAAEQLARTFSCEVVCLSRGERGGGFWREGKWAFHPGFRVEVASSVGAGDAFLAGLIDSLCKGKSDQEAIETANLLGAFAATRIEAAPVFSRDDLDLIRSHSDKRTSGPQTD